MLRSEASSSIPQLTPACPSTSDTDLRFVARQPILDGAQKLFAYELLFRSGADIAFADMEYEHATTSVLDLSLLVGANSFTDGYRAFVNCTSWALGSGVVRTLPKDLVVLEILEDVPCSEEILQRCRELKAEGYTLAVDDIVCATERVPLIELADIIKVDFLLASESQQQDIAKRFLRPNVQLLAEKVETHEQFHNAVKMGYTLFQGYFFCRPETLRTKDLPSTHLGYLNVLRRAHEPEVNILELADIIREEPSLSYRLLRYLNSAAWGVHQVKSIVHALNLLGRDEIRKWVSVVAAISLAGPRSQELIRMTLIRARYCELVAEHLQVAPSDYFLTGMFSLLEAILDRPLAQIVEHIPISDSCRAALNGEKNKQGLALELAVASGAGYWDKIPGLCSKLRCTESDACRWQLQSQNWVRDILQKKHEENTPRTAARV